MLFKTNYSLISTKLCRFVDSVEVGEVKKRVGLSWTLRIENENRTDILLIPY